MARYTVTIISSDAGAQNGLRLLVPFEPTAAISAFIDELFVRLQRQDISLAPNTHTATLHLDTETGAIIDSQDILADVVDPSDKLFAVFKKKQATPASANPANSGHAHTAQPISEDGGPHLKVRVITPALAKQDRSGIQPIIISAAATVKQLQDTIATHLSCSNDGPPGGIENECNCSLARKLADWSASEKHFLVCYGKSETLKLDLPSVATKSTITEILQKHFGEKFLEAKKITLNGRESIAYEDHEDEEVETVLKKAPIVAICSKQRHVPSTAKATMEKRLGTYKRVLDLHTPELPINQACADVRLNELGLQPSAVDGDIIEIFVVERAVYGGATIVAGTGKSTIFRDHVHWEPGVKQSDRGIAMFLSSLRVFASIVQDMGTDDRSKDAVYHIFDLLTKFPPAFRALHIILEGKTPTSVEAAALSHAVFDVLDSFMPMEIIGKSRARLFEGARLLFGFILEKARTVKLGEDHASSLPYLASMEVIDIRDAKTREAVFRGAQTNVGLIEKALFGALSPDGILFESPLQSTLLSLVDEETNVKKERVALLSGGIAAEITIFSSASLATNYQYPDGGIPDAVFDISELKELHHLAELCGRNKLSVYRPSQLTSAVAPCLTFDRDAHLAVYTGQLPCSMPGKSSQIFRPRRGEETIDEAVVEQLIASLLKDYEADGTAVFDLLGGAAVRRMQEADEIIMFAVDTSSSMRLPTDFADVNDEVPTSAEQPTARDTIPPEFYSRTTFDDLKDQVSDHESFDDMVAIVGEASRNRQRRVALEVIDILRQMLSSQILQQESELERRQTLARNAYYRTLTEQMRSKLDIVKAFWAALQTHESDLCDFLIFRANTTPDVGKRWMWHPGQELPAGSRAEHLPSLPADITDVPDDYLCPISHGLMEDAAKALDGFTYSRQAIQEWFRIRSSALTSPMTNLALARPILEQNQAISTGVARWIQGENLLGTPSNISRWINNASGGPSFLRLRFNCRVGNFERLVPTTMSLHDLYKVVFRALKARFLVFQLSINNETQLPSIATLSSKNIKDGQEVTVRLADDGAMSVTASGTSATTRTGEMCLVKVYHARDLKFSYWVQRDANKTLGSILWKYWRSKFSAHHSPRIDDQTVWTDMETTGDGMYRGTSRSPSDDLAPLLTPEHCFGILGNEPLHRVDDANTQTSSTDTDPLVLKVHIAKAWSRTSKAREAKLSRLDVLKQMFEAMINRMLAYSYKSHVGLCTFASEARVTTGITHVLENFRRATANMEADGDTALWDAIALCKDQLDQYKEKFPKAKRRIIVISDGDNTKSSSHSPSELAWQLSQDGIALDSVILGAEASQDLKGISYFMGCYTFQPTTLPNALLTCELEPFLSLTERPPITPPAHTPSRRLDFLQNFWTAFYLAQPTVVTADRYPDRKQHANLHDSVVQLAAASARPMRAAAAGNSRSKLRINRLMNEMRTIVANGTHPNYDIYVSESDMSFWKVVMAGPDDSPYSEGTFLAYIHAGESYPTFAPDVRFVTKIKHPNVNAHGRICHALLSRDWTSDTSMSTILDTVFGLLMQAETSDPVNTAATLGYHHDQVEYADEVREFVIKHALKDREEWRKELLEEESDEDEEDPNEDMGQYDEDEEDEFEGFD